MLRPCFVAALLAWSPAAFAQEQLPPPPLPAPRVVTERGPSPNYYRLSPRVVLPLVRAGFGAQFRSAPDEASGSVAFTLDVMGGVVLRADRASPYGVLAEAGYSFAGFSQHLAALGLGAVVGLGAMSDREGRARPAGFRVAVAEHVLAGASYGVTAVGLRSGVIVASASYAVELSHQVLFVDGEDHNEFRLTLTSLLPFGEME
ncbi:MAG: hypothetical protein U0326_03270 [Polyangiales bacterium]